MKNTIKYILITIAIITTLMILTTIEHTYTRDVIVHKIDNNTQEITVIDTNYNVWKYYTQDTTQYTVGQEITVVMNDNHTDSNIKDDKIVEVKW
jgi:hypothetical protein